MYVYSTRQEVSSFITAFWPCNFVKERTHFLASRVHTYIHKREQDSYSAVISTAGSSKLVTGGQDRTGRQVRMPKHARTKIQISFQVPCAVVCFLVRVKVGGGGKEGGGRGGGGERKGGEGRGSTRMYNTGTHMRRNEGCPDLDERRAW